MPERLSAILARLKDKIELYEDHIRRGSLWDEETEKSILLLIAELKRVKANEQLLKNFAPQDTDKVNELIRRTEKLEGFLEQISIAYQGNDKRLQKWLSHLPPDEVQDIVHDLNGIVRWIKRIKKDIQREEKQEVNAIPAGLRVIEGMLNEICTPYGVAKGMAAVNDFIQKNKSKLESQNIEESASSFVDIFNAALKEVFWQFTSRFQSGSATHLVGLKVDRGILQNGIINSTISNSIKSFCSVHSLLKSKGFSQKKIKRLLIPKTMAYGIDPFYVEDEGGRKIFVSPAVSNGATNIWSLRYSPGDEYITVNLAELIYQ